MSVMCGPMSGQCICSSIRLEHECNWLVDYLRKVILKHLKCGAVWMCGCEGRRVFNNVVCRLRDFVTLSRYQLRGEMFLLCVVQCLVNAFVLQLD